ncbi:MAG: Uncharacterised protein [Cyanobium sp. ARS6]|nr:MAG: Uncharacterised protein [Cyanobium sp. ARS6]
MKRIEIQADTFQSIAPPAVDIDRIDRESYVKLPLKW